MHTNSLFVVIAATTALFPTVYADDRIVLLRSTLIPKFTLPDGKRGPVCSYAHYLHTPGTKEVEEHGTNGWAAVQPNDPRWYPDCRPKGYYKEYYVNNKKYWTWDEEKATEADEKRLQKIQEEDSKAREAKVKVREEALRQLRDIQEKERQQKKSHGK
ncbi:hypothetical protein MCOR27_009651 [Pyricularia oryzae]|uniref:Uncharacterized protein n=2 Tax=Pyricularia TaxID=48558 RepID=A0ABQ8NY88_PYRGI|nr:hypothetical protein MCOR27_009651 [Pyricularia oryzae]KAI6303578.1 hypothetical protein MCOR33_001271 [Pyricularia grisea]KAI6299584.1 hypothetical protein MCOR34_009168 [Pyricularia oryzae]KAI6318987.1 hypothetical protein MCOR30_008793 [Pyricularia oryzae]KAI6378184.1 hypothetical protein MCOR31_000741 [Pyricularia oryzae]